MFKNLLVGAVAAPLLFAAFSASAMTYSFTNITNNSNISLSDQLAVDVTGDATNVYFKFTNNTFNNDVSSVGQIYFDIGTSSLSNMTIFAENGVDFNIGANPGELPGGNTISFVSEFQFGAVKPAPKNGIADSSDFLTISGTGNLASITTALSSGNFKIGMHVIALADGKSDGYVTSPSSVPVPAALPLMASALGAFGIARRRNKAKAA